MSSIDSGKRNNSRIASTTSSPQTKDGKFTKEKITAIKNANTDIDNANLSKMLESKQRLIKSGLPSVNPLDQGLAAENQIFRLEKQEDSYSMVSHSGEKLKADGVYIYVISVDSPTEILCASQKVSQGRVAGHTSLTGRKNVLFAGELFFTDGKLNRWNNGSGHYKPDSSNLETALSPYVKLLLPQDKFVLFDEETADKEALIGRGYDLEL